VIGVEASISSSRAATSAAVPSTLVRRRRSGSGRISTLLWSVVPAAAESHFAVKLGLVHQRVARVAPRILLAVGDVNHAAVDDAVARGILACGLQRVEIDTDFPAAADACKSHIELGCAPNRFRRARAPQ